MPVFEGKLDGRGLRVGLVVSRFNELVTRELLLGAEDRLRRLGVRDEDIVVLWVPGAFELPRAVRILAESGKVDGIVALAAWSAGKPRISSTSQARWPKAWRSSPWRGRTR